MSYLVFSLLFLLPLFVFPFGPAFFEPPKVILAECLIDLFLISLIFKKGFSFQKLNLQYLLLVGIIVLLTGVDLVFFNTATTFLGNPFRLQGVLLVWHLLIWSIVSSQIKIAVSKWFFVFPFVALTGAAFMLGGNQAGRAVGTLGEPNALAATMLFIWPFLFFLSPPIFLPKWSFKAFSFVLTMIVIILSGSRSGILALLIQLLFLFSTTKLSLVKSVLISLSLLALGMFLPFIDKGGWYENRSEIWLTSLVSGFKSPLLGQGFGNIEHTLKNSGLELRNNLQYQYVDSAHNIVLDFWLQAGLLGVIIIVLLIYETIKNFLSQGRKLELICFLGLLTMLTFNPLSVVNLLAFWWLLGQGHNK